MKKYVFQGLKLLLYVGLTCMTFLFYKTPAQATNDIPISEEYFPDAQFRSYVADNLDPNFDGILTTDEIENVMEINFVGKINRAVRKQPTPEEMISVKGLEFFKNLHSLTISKAPIDKIDVSMFKKLIYLDVSNNYLTSLDVKNNTDLEELNCFFNCLEQIDLSNNTSLKVVNIRKNNISTIDIRNNTLLQELNIIDNPISSINLSKCPELKNFSCSGTNLKQINIGYNPFLCLAVYPRTPDRWEFNIFDYFYRGPNDEAYDLVCNKELDIVEVPYNDVRTNMWGYPAILYTFNNKYMVGMGNETFAPEGIITRAQFIQILYNIEGKPSVTFSDRFTDVLPNQWYSDAVSWAANNHLTAGINEYEFGTNLPITREQLITLFYNYGQTKEYYRKKIDPDCLDDYKDIDQISPWALDAVRWSVSCYITVGKGAFIDPKSNATREECAQMIQNMLFQAPDPFYNYESN